ncbi:cyclohexadienyl dehydrogenase [Rhodobacterales bacterium HTCC2150]|nr:cyclohexadienyl dehydrogenase [Rhodobacterales bacterium HTCC2150] [Rhodobacteraceae bacterium HTCC2150]
MRTCTGLLSWAGLLLGRGFGLSERKTGGDVASETTGFDTDCASTIAAVAISSAALTSVTRAPA